MSEHSPIKILEMHVANVLIRDESDFIKNMIDKIAMCKPTEVYGLAVRYREEKRNLFVPFLLAYGMMKVKGHKNIVDILITDISETIEDLVMMLEIYRSLEKENPLASCIKRGIRSAIPNVDIEKAKNKDNIIFFLKMFHPIPKDEEQSRKWKDLIVSVGGKRED